MTLEFVGDSLESRKARGAFFTPPQVTRFLANWAVRRADDRVLEPSAGDGAIIAAVVERLHQLGGRTPVQAHELHEQSANATRDLLTQLGHSGEVSVGDFLRTPATHEFDAVVGNPPYIRYQGFVGEARAAGLAAALAQGVRLSRLSSSWAPFVIHSAAQLNDSGRLALVLPAELLSSNYAQEVRDYLLGRFAEVSVVLIGGLVFPGVQTEAVLLLAEGLGSTDQVRFATIDDRARLDAVDFDTILEARPGERWTDALVPAEVGGHLSNLTAAGVVTAMTNWGRLSLGAVTGNNRYFTMSPRRAQELGLSHSDLIAISPAGSSHLRALSFSRSDHTRLGRAEQRTLLFRPPSDPNPAAQAYINFGESQDVHKAYKCRIRDPWWRTPLPAPPSLFFTYMNEETPQLATNPGKLHYLNSVHGLYLRAELEELADILPLAALNTVTALSAEITGRSYGGGILKMEPREAVQLLVPSIATVNQHAAELRKALPRVRRLLKSGQLEGARSLADEILFGAAGQLQVVSQIGRTHTVLSQRRRSRAQSRATPQGKQ